VGWMILGPQKKNNIANFALCPRGRAPLLLRPEKVESSHCASQRFSVWVMEGNLHSQRRRGGAQQQAKAGGLWMGARCCPSPHAVSGGGGGATQKVNTRLYPLRAGQVIDTFVLGVEVEHSRGILDRTRGARACSAAIPPPPIPHHGLTVEQLSKLFQTLE
jgi:hypothetical protein